MTAAVTSAKKWMLAIDFGTTNTAAAVCDVDDPARATEVKLSTASSGMPSAVLASSDDLLAGEIAVNSWVTAPPGSYEPKPKSQVGHGEVLLGGKSREVAELVAAVLAAVRTKAMRRYNNTPPAQVRLTHPATWSRARLGVLRDAAARADLGSVMLVPEPVAAAAYYAQRHAGTADGTVAVYDLGGGTLDVAVLRRTTSDAGQSYEVLSSDGVDPLGGETFDQLLQRHVVDVLSHRGDTAIADLLVNGDLGLGEQRSFLESVRNAKHTLSEVPSAAVSVSGGGRAAVVTVTRDEFHQLIDPYIDTSLETVRRALRTARLEARDVDRLYLVGGSSFIPRIAERLTAEIGITPATFDDPKLVTCVGALHHEATASRQRDSESQPPSRRPPPQAQRQPPPQLDEPADVAALGKLATLPVQQLKAGLAELNEASRRQLLEIERANKNRKSAIKAIEESLRPPVEDLGTPPAWQAVEARRAERRALSDDAKERILAVFRGSQPTALRNNLIAAIGPPLRTFAVKYTPTGYTKKLGMDLLVHEDVLCLVASTVGRVNAFLQWRDEPVDRLMFIDDITYVTVFEGDFGFGASVSIHGAAQHRGRKTAHAQVSETHASLTVQTRAATELCMLLRNLYEQGFDAAHTTG